MDCFPRWPVADTTFCKPVSAESMVSMPTLAGYARLILLQMALLVGAMTWWLPPSAMAQFGNRATAGAAGEDPFLLAPRALSRLLREGETAIADGRYTEGVRLLGALLQENSEEIPEDLRGQDFFIESAPRGLIQKSVKGEATRLLSLLSEEGRRTLEIQFGVTARKELDNAVAKRDFHGIAEVARKYMHTEAGYDAQILIAQHKLVGGFPLAAAGMFQSLLDYPAARARYGVELVKTAAMAWLQADNANLATATLRRGAIDFPGGSLVINGQQLALAANTDWKPVVDAWQADLQGIVVTSSSTAWLNAGGSPERNARAQAGLPLTNARWVKEIHSSVPERDALREVELTARKSGNVLLPKFELRMIDDVVITKTTDAGVIGIDFETGNTKWVHYFGSSAAPLRSVGWNRNFTGDDSVSRELQKRVWGSSAFGRFSCDHERFYYVSSEGQQPINASMLFGGMPVGRDSNYLEGVSIAAQGAVVWRVGGATGQDEPRLSGAYFLGPPLAFEGELFAIAEINGEVRLLVLHPATGRLLWQQQLAQAAMLPIMYDEGRQCQALSPTIADGVILCPTGTGAVVAVDLLSRSLLWGATYRGAQANTMNRFGGAFGVSMPEFQPLGRRWEDTGMIADRGRVVFTPPDSEWLICRDTLTGESILASHPRRNARYVAGMYEDKVILVGETSVSAVGLVDKRVAWEYSYPEGAVLTGKGLWRGDSMLLPLSGQRIVQLELSTGELSGEVEVDQPLGNLFAYRDQLLSVTSTAVSAFYTRDALRQDVEMRLAKNGEDVWALNHKAQLLLAEGDIEGALKLLSKSYTVDRENVDTRYYLVETILKGIETDFVKYFPMANELNEAVEYGPQRYRYLQQLALGSLRSGKALVAFERLMELMEDRMKLIYSGNPPPTTRIKLDERHTADSDTWLATALAKAYQAATPAERQKMDELVVRSMKSVEGTMAPLRRQRLHYLQWLPAASEAALALSAELLGGTEQASAEQILQPLLYGEHIAPAQSQQARALLAQPTQADLRRLGPAGNEYTLLEFPDGSPGATGAHRAAARAGDDGVAAGLQQAAIRWNDGMVNHQVVREFALFPLGRRIELSGERYGRPEYAISLSDSLLAVSNANGENVGNMRYAAASSDITNAYNRGVCRGGLLLLETASEIVAFDLYRALAGEVDSQLWRYSLVGAAADQPFVAATVSVPNAALGINLPKRQLQGSQPASVGPLTPVTQVVQAGTSIHGLDLLSGRRVWTREGYDDSVRFAHSGLEVAIISPSEGSIQVIDCRDGQLLRTVEYRGNWTHWFSHKQHVVDFQQDGNSGALLVRIWDAIANETLREFTVPFTARAAQAESRYLVIAEPGKGLIFADLESGLIHESEQGLGQDLGSVALARFQNTLVVMGQANVRTRQPVRSLTEESADGLLVALDIATGEPLWNRPAKVAGMTFPLAQPRNSPFMVLYRFEDGEAPTFAACVLLDLRDGSICFSNNKFLVRNRGFNMRLRPMDQRIELAIGDRNYQLHITDEERPPQPVAMFGFDKVRNAPRRGSGIIPRN
jgi:hypothetical protein